MKGILHATLWLGYWLMTKAVPVILVSLAIFGGTAAWVYKATEPASPTAEQKLYQAAEEERAINRSLGQPEGTVIPELRDSQLRQLGQNH